MRKNELIRTRKEIKVLFYQHKLWDALAFVWFTCYLYSRHITIWFVDRFVVSLTLEWLSLSLFHWEAPVLFCVHQTNERTKTRTMCLGRLCNGQYTNTYNICMNNIYIYEFISNLIDIFAITLFPRDLVSFMKQRVVCLWVFAALLLFLVLLLFVCALLSRCVYTLTSPWRQHYFHFDLQLFYFLHKNSTNSNQIWRKSADWTWI